MQVYLAEHAGFCWGVERAINIAKDIASNQKRPVYTDGPLIHNKQLMEQLNQEGITEIGDYQSNSSINLSPDQRSKDPVLVVRAHGISPQRREYLKSLGLQFKDATCPDVGIIAGKIRLYAKKGYSIVIFGDPKHPEVIGLLGYTENNGHVIHDENDIANLPHLGNLVCMVSQSTMFPDEFQKLASLLQQKYPSAIIIDTICNATKERQSDIDHFVSLGVKAIVVIGGKHSSNTQKLVTLSEKKGIPAFHIETLSDLDLSSISRFNPLGLTAGASTPSYLIQEVYHALLNLPPSSP